MNEGRKKGGKEGWLEKIKEEAKEGRRKEKNESI